MKVAAWHIMGAVIMLAGIGLLAAGKTDLATYAAVLGLHCNYWAKDEESNP